MHPCTVHVKGIYSLLSTVCIHVLVILITCKSLLHGLILSVYSFVDKVYNVSCMDTFLLSNNHYIMYCNIQWNLRIKDTLGTI